MKKMVFDGKQYKVFDHAEFEKMNYIQESIDYELGNISAAIDTLVLANGAGDDIYKALAECEILIEQLKRLMHENTKTRDREVHYEKFE